MNERITVKKLFWAWNYEKEEKWLREMSNKGYEFNSWSIGKYRFTKKEPSDVIYKLDYNPKWCRNSSDYMEFIKECGWEFCDSMCGWNLYRCDADKCLSKEIYTGKDKIKIIHRIGTFAMVLSVLEGVCFFMGFIKPMIEGRWPGMVYTILWSFLILEFLIIDINLYSAYRKKKKEL